MVTGELRIGNYYFAPLEIIGSAAVKIDVNKDRVFCLSLDALILINQLNLIDLIKPIPLTEDWLTKFGFEDKAEMSPPTYILNNVPIDFRYDYFWYDLGFDGIYRKIDFVHQLQNLFFALRGEELTIKEPALK